MLNPVVDDITQNGAVLAQAENSGISNVNRLNNAPMIGYVTDESNPQNTYHRVRARRGSEATVQTPVGNVETTGRYSNHQTFGQPSEMDGIEMPQSTMNSYKEQQSQPSAINVLADKTGVASTQIMQQNNHLGSFNLPGLRHRWTTWG